MRIFDALGDAAGVVRRRPVLVPLLFLGSLPLPFLNSLDLWVRGGELLGRVLSLFVAPFLLGGSYGLASEALDDGEVTPSTFLLYGADNYLSILGASLLLYIGALVAGVGLAVLLLIPVLNILVAVAMIPLGILLALVLQFVNVAIVVDDQGAVAAYSRSYRVAMDHLGSVFGYVLVRGLLALAFLIPTIVALFQEMSSASDIETYTAGPTVTGAVALFALGSVVLMPFHVAFYRRISQWAATPSGATGSETPEGETGSTAGAESPGSWET